MSSYTKMQLQALFDAEYRLKEDQFVMKTSLYIKKQVVELARKGITSHVWTSDDVISQRVLVELCKALQNVFQDCKVTKNMIGITIDWS